jgi:hypothetical protein
MTNKQTKQAKRSSGPWDFLGLPRPQYAPSAEVLVSSLVWDITEKKSLDLDGQKNDGLVYRKTAKGLSGKRNIVETTPKRNGAKWQALAQHLDRELGIYDPSHADQAVGILCEDFVGSVPPRANAKAIVPLTLTSALMQDVRGMSGVDNPPDFAKIIGRMYALGGGEASASALLVESLAGIKANWLDDFIKKMAPDEVSALASTLSGARDHHNDNRRPVPVWLDNASSPYRWFAVTWQNLMANGWIDVMPRRRWIDWAACVLRTALGTGFVFEMNFYYQLVLGLDGVEAPVEVRRKCLSSSQPFFLWDAMASVSSRDVASKVKKLCDRGTACRTMLSDWIDEDESFPLPANFIDHEEGLENWIEAARTWLVGHAASEALRKRLAGALSGKANRSAKNVYELTRYALQDRGSASEEDLYSMMRKRGQRYTVVEPGQEWFVVVASLIAPGPGSRARVADLVSSLELLGIEASYQTITSELERVGLGRSSHDADDAIEIATAF